MNAPMFFRTAYGNFRAITEIEVPVTGTWLLFRRMHYLRYLYKLENINLMDLKKNLFKFDSNSKKIYL